MAGLRLCLLGEVQIYVDGVLVEEAVTVKTRALLCYLAVTAVTHTRHALSGLLWGDVSEDKAKNSLRVALAHLRKLLPDHLTVTHQTVAFNQDSDYVLDVAELDDLLTGSMDDAAQTLPPIIALYRGDFLADLVIEDVPEFEAWRWQWRTHWQERVTAVLSQLTQTLLTRRAYEPAIAGLCFLLQIAPGEEKMHQDLMLAYGRLGDFAAALAQYQHCQQWLADEFNLEPMPETTRLFERLQTAQVIGRSQPPQPTEPFVGRRAELDEIQQKLHDPTCRLVTVIGLGGNGKTRLVLEAARLLAEERPLSYLHGVFFVSLQAVEDVTALPLVVADALPLTLAGAAPVEAQLIHYLQDKEMLLVLDNFEQLLDGVWLLSQILNDCPDVKLLVTSREPLHLLAEWRLLLDGLAYPMDEIQPDGRAYEAIDLFQQTVLQVRPDTELDRAQAGRICRLVAGSPLAIKLAVNWLRSLSLAEIEAEIRRNLDILAADLPDIPARQRSMRVIFDYTWNLLMPPEQRIFAALSVFRGDFTIEAAEMVAAARPFLLANLVDHGLLERREQRYHIHTLARQYGQEQLVAMGEEERVYGRFCQYYAQFVQQYENPIRQSGYQAALQALTAEQDNIRAAWRWLVAHLHSEDTTAVARLALIQQLTPTLALYYQFRYLIQVGRNDFAKAAEVLQGIDQEAWVDEKQTAALQRAFAQVQNRAALFEGELGNFDTAIQLAQAITPLLRENQFNDELAYNLNTLGRCKVRQGKREEANNLLSESIALLRQLNDVLALPTPLNNLAIAALDRGDYEQSQSLLQEALSIYKSNGYTPGVAHMLCNLGSVYARQNDPDTALPMYQESLQAAETVGHKGLIMVNMSNIGSSYRANGRYDEAQNYYRRSLKLAREIGNQRWIVANLNGLGETLLDLRQFEQANHALQEGVQLAAVIKSKPDALEALAIQGHVWAQQGRLAKALRLFLFVKQHPAATERSLAKNATILAELADELPVEMIQEAESWVTDKTLIEVTEWTLGAE